MHKDFHRRCSHWSDVWPTVRERLGVNLPNFVYREYHDGQKARERGLV